jgi:hypothetical protein
VLRNCEYRCFKRRPFPPGLAPAAAPLHLVPRYWRAEACVTARLLY